MIFLSPIAYHLTSVPRSPLPLDAIQLLDLDQSTQKLTATLDATRRFTVWQANTNFDIDTNEYLPQFRLHRTPVDIKDPSMMEMITTKHAEDDDHVMDVHLFRFVTQLQLQDEVIIFVLCNDDKDHNITLGTHRHGWTHGCTISMEQQRILLAAVFPAMIDPTIRVSLKYRWSFTLLHARPSTHTLSWERELKSSAMAYMEPLAMKLAGLADVSLESQSFLYATLAKVSKAEQ
jgi:hypothetical protein